MSRIAILGANGQVGAEVALLLHARADVELRCVVRSPYSAVLFRLADVPFAVVDYRDHDSLRRALGDRDLVVDLTYPSGHFVDFPRVLSANIESTMRAMTRGAGYLYMGSIMAYGMPTSDVRVRHYRVPRTSYGRIKRHGESLVFRHARPTGVRPFVCRLGQAHGVLQSATAGFLGGLRRGDLRLEGEPGQPTITIFANAVADAIVRFARGELAERRLYTLVSNPQWSLGQFIEVCGKLARGAGDVTYVDPATVAASTGQPSRRAALSRGLRDILETQLLLRVPWLYPRVKGLYRRRAVAGELRRRPANAAVAVVRPILGEVPGPLVPGLDCSIESAVESYAFVEEKLEALVNRGRLSR